MIRLLTCYQDAYREHLTTARAAVLKPSYAAVVPEILIQSYVYIFFGTNKLVIGLAHALLHTAFAATCQ